MSKFQLYTTICDGNLRMKLFILLCSWYCSWREKLAAIFSYYTPWYCKWNTNSSTEDAVCCIYNLLGYVKCFFLYVELCYLLISYQYLKFCLGCPASMQDFIQAYNFTFNSLSVFVMLLHRHIQNWCRKLTDQIIPFDLG